jgi:hypothetical protein
MHHTRENDVKERRKKNVNEQRKKDSKTVEAG